MFTVLKAVEITVRAIVIVSVSIKLLVNDKLNTALFKVLAVVSCIIYLLTIMQVIDLGIIAGGAILIGLSDAESNITAEMVAGVQP